MRPLSTLANAEAIADVAGSDLPALRARRPPGSRAQRQDRACRAPAHFAQGARSHSRRLGGPAHRHGGIRERKVSGFRRSSAATPTRAGCSPRIGRSARWRKLRPTRSRISALGGSDDVAVPNEQRRRGQVRSVLRLRRHPVQLRGSRARARHVGRATEDVALSFHARAGGRDLAADPQRGRSIMCSATSASRVSCRVGR